MAIFSSIASLALAILIIALNALASLFGKRFAVFATALSLALHVAIAPVMLLSGCPLAELALVYLVSFFAYILPLYIKGRRDGGDL